MQNEETYVDDCFKINNFESHDVRYFAMLHNAVAIKGDKNLEGGVPREAIAYYRYLLNINLPHCPLEFNLKEPQLTSVNHRMSNLFNMVELVKKFFPDKNCYSKNNLDAVIDEIDKNCNEENVAYFPSGFKNIDVGHFAGLKIRKLANGNYVFSCINHGEGMQYHRQISSKGTKIHYSYESSQFEINLKSDEGREFLKHVIELCLDSQKGLKTEKYINPYSSDDLYGLLEVYGTKIKEPSLEDLKEKRVTTQRTGTCPITNTNAMARDSLIDNHVDYDTRKRFYFIIKLRSLIDGFNQYCEGKYKRDVIEWALNEFSVRINKVSHLLSVDEVTYCVAIQNKIKSKLNQDKEEEIKKSCASEKFPKLEGEAPKYYQHIFDRSKTSHAKKEKKLSEEKQEKLPEKIDVRPENIKNIVTFEKIGPFDFKKIYNVFNLLPHCTGLEKDPFWDKVPPEDIERIIDKLHKITRMLRDFRSIDRDKKMALSFMIYDIAAQLASRYSKFKLGGVYAFGLDDVYSEQHFFTDPIAYYTVKRITKNFELRAKDKKRIFTNAVNYKKYDHTIHYVINILFDDYQRRTLTEALRHKESRSSRVKYTDIQLFKYIVDYSTDIIDEYDPRRRLLEEGPIGNIIAISGTAHSLGDYTKDYIEGEFFYFSNNQFQRQVQRILRWDTREIDIRLPEVESVKGITDYRDYSENTIFQPNIIKAREDINNLDYQVELPYQVQLSGSFYPNSEVWKPANNQKLLYEQLNEDLRIIECSPNFQVVKTLDWAIHHIDRLRNKDVRTRINELIFQYGKLDSAFSNQFEITMTNMMSFLEALHKYCKEEANDDLNLLIWATNLTSNLRYYLEVSAKLYELPVSKYAFPSFKEELLHQIQNEKEVDVRSRLASQLINQFHHVGPLTLDDCCLILACRLAANLGDFANVSDECWEILKSELISVIKNKKDEASKIINQLLSTYHITSVNEWKLVDTTFQSVGTDFFIDLETGSLQEKGENKLKKERTAKTITENKALFDALHFDPKQKLFYTDADPKMLKTDDGKFEFSYTSIENIETGTQFSIHTTYQTMTIEGVTSQFKLLDEGEVNSFFDTNPFESVNSLNANYQYWKSMDDNDLVFVRNKNKELAYSYSKECDNAINQLIQNESGEWVRNEKELLNLVKPQTLLEREWAERLGPLFGLTNVCCIASLKDNHSKWCLEKIEHLTLGLSFSANNKQKLMCNEIPGYYLSEQRSIEALNGLQSIIILENDKKERKYIIPAFSFNEGEKNNAFNHIDIINFGLLCNQSSPYYSYFLNDQNELVTESVEGNLYLAIMYRTIGDFEKAIKYLDRCKNPENIDVKIGEIAMQVLKRRIISPLSAAFNLKLACYIKEHQEKWSKKGESKPFILPQPVWKDFLEGELAFYKNTLSSYKRDVAIIPTYCRLTEHEWKMLNPEEDKTLTAVSIPPEPSQRFESASQLPKESDWERYTINYKKYIYEEKSEPLTTMRLYMDNDNPACHYLVNHFSDLFMDAISDNENRLDHLNQVLFILLQNDRDPSLEFYALMALLIHVREYPDYFKNLVPQKDIIKFIMNVVKVVYKKYEIKDKKIYLFSHEYNPYSLLQEVALPDEFVPEGVKFKIAQIEYEKSCKHPLEDIAKKYFMKKEEPIAKEEFKLELTSLENPTLLERKLFDRFKSGHDENKQKMKAVYEFTSTQMLTNLKVDLEKIKEDDKEKLKIIHSTLLKQANRTPLEDSNASIHEKAEAYHLLQAQASGQKHKIAMNDLFAAFLKKDPTLLTEQNPFLKQNDIEKLFSELANYALLSSRSDQIKQALDIVDDKTTFSENEKYQEQLLAGIIDKHRAYDINDYPEFLVYEYATHRLLREDQVLVLTKLINLIENKSGNEAEMRHALLQFAAGGGKTSVLIPILAQRFAQHDLLPVIINTTELYDIGLEEIPKNLRQCFKQNIEVVERDLDYTWTEADLKKLLNDLEQWKTEHKCLLIKSVTWHSINIAMKSAYFHYAEYQSIQTDDPIEQAEAKIKAQSAQALGNAAQAVLDFFKTQAVKLEDECHIVSDPMHQNIKTDGKLRKIPNSHHNLLLCFYDYLMGRKSKTSGIAKLAGIKSDPKRSKKRQLKQSELAELQSKLATVIVGEEFFNQVSPHALIQYLIAQNKDIKDEVRPEWLENLYKSNDEKQQELADLIVLARAFIQTHLPHILSLEYLKDYGTSIHKGDLTVAPKHEGNSVTSHFGDHTLVAALTIQLYEQQGLLAEQAEELLDQLIDSYKKERSWNADYTKPTEAERWLRDALPSIAFPIFKSNKDAQAMKLTLMADIDFRKNSHAIKKYLREFALSQVGVPKKRITSMSAEMQAGFTRSILFSATPSVPELYPAFLNKQNCFLEESFEAQVIDTLIQNRNRAIIPLKKIKTPTDFFDQFPKDELKKINTLIDRGSLLTAFEGEEIIRSYLALDQDRISAQTAAFFSKSKKHMKQKMELVTKDHSLKDTEILGAGLVQELKNQGKNPEEFLLFLFLDLSKTTGTDIARPYTDHAGLTVGKEQTVTETIQAAMRERKLLEKDAQTVTWIMFKSLYHAIYPNALPDTFDTRQIFYWMIKNEAKEIETKLENRAYQGIYQAITAIVWKKIQNDPQLMLAYNNALEEIQEISPYKIYEKCSKKEKTALVLNQYKNDLLNAFNFKEEHLPNETQLLINKIIDETSILISELQNPSETQLGVQVEQEMQQKQQDEQEKEMEQQQRIKNKNDNKTDFIFEVERYNFEKDNLNTIFNESVVKQQRYVKPRLPHCDGIRLPELFLCPSHFSVTEQANKSDQDEVEELKPIQQILIRIMPNHQMKFVACTGAGFEYYADLINQAQSMEKYPAYAIISIKGSILHASHNISVPALSQLIDRDDCQKMLTYAHFLNGEISHPIKLGQIVKEQGWSKADYERLVNGILNVHVSQHKVSLLQNEVLEAYCGWNKKMVEINMSTDKREEKSSVIEYQAIRPMEVLENRMESTDIPLMKPKHALWNILLGEEPQPIPIHADENVSLKTRYV